MSIVSVYSTWNHRHRGNLNVYAFKSQIPKSIIYSNYILFSLQILCNLDYDINEYLLMMRTQLLITCDTIRYTHHILPLTTRTFVLRIHKLSIAAMVMKEITMISLTCFSATRSLRMAAFNIQAVTK